MRSLLTSFIAATVLLTACNNKGEGDASGEDSLLSTDLVYNPATAGGNDQRDFPTLSFKDSVHNFGTVREGEKVEHAFTFTNTGKAPLLITGATASCGCTVPEYPREPVAPGKGGTLRVTFDTKGKPGHQEKTVTVTSNSARTTQYLNITAEVQPAE